MVGVEYRNFLEEALTEAEKWGPDDDALLRKIEIETERLLLKPAERAEEDLDENETRNAQEQCRKILKPIWEIGPFGHEITHWPDGPGSATSMEFVYRNSYPLRDVKSHLTEKFLLTRDLGHAVRSRKNMLRDFLVDELNKREGAVDILDVACGPCQSLREALPLIANPQRVNLCAIDTDELNQKKNEAYFCKSQKLPWRFEVKNALRLPYTPASQDIIYSTGLYDYLSDRLLAKLWCKTYEALKPGGLAALCMKDGGKFNSLFYRWAIEWDQFHIRTDKEILDIAKMAELPEPEEIRRDATGIIMMILVSKKVD